MTSMLTSKHSRQKSAEELPNHLRRNTSSNYIVMILPYLYYWYFTIYLSPPTAFPHHAQSPWLWNLFCFKEKQQFKLSGATQALSSLEILIEISAPLHCLSLLPAILQLAVFHCVIHWSCCNPEPEPQSQPISSVGRSPQSQRDLTDELCGLQSTCAGMWEGAQTHPQRQRQQLPSFLWKYCRLRLTQASLKTTLGLSLLQAQSWVLMRMVFSIKAASIISQHYAPGRGNENQLLLGSHTGEQLTFPVI